MPWLTPPYPLGYQMPGIGYFLLISGITLCFIGIVMYAVATELPEVVPPPTSPDPSVPDAPGECREHRESAESR